MSKTKQTAAKGDERYRVLIPCANDETGKRYKVGSVVTAADFGPAVIKEWLTADKPVLERVTDGSS